MYRELEISAAEERSLKKDVPKSEEEFEKLARSSPNSSYVWINYMAFMLDVADVEKARSIAERYLLQLNCLISIISERNQNEQLSQLENLK